MGQVRYHKQKEEHEKLIHKLKQDVSEIKDKLNGIRSRRVSSSVRDDLQSILVQ